MTTPDARPNFFILGAPKCGTTSLHSYLSQHHEIFMTAEKEPHFFDNDRNYKLGFEHYLATHFAGAEHYKVRGESTSNYVWRHAKAIPRLKRHLDTEVLKFAIILRDPVKRAWSHFLHARRLGWEQEDFGTALALEEMRMQQDPGNWNGYFRAGLYARHITAWFEHFPHDSFLIVLTEDLNRSPRRIFHQICQFLEVDPGFPLDAREYLNKASVPRSGSLVRFLNHHHPIKEALKTVVPRAAGKMLTRMARRMNLSTQVPPLDAGIAQRLRYAYEDEVTALEGILSRDLSSWKPVHRAREPEKID